MSDHHCMMQHALRGVQYEGRVLAPSVSSHLQYASNGSKVYMTYTYILYRWEKTDSGSLP